jgi:hypothetical protein
MCQAMLDVIAESTASPFQSGGRAPCGALQLRKRMLRGISVASIAEPGPYQRDIGRARRQQADGEEHLDALERGFEGGFHHGESIRRFWRRSLGQYFSPDSGLVYDSGTAADAACPRRPAFTSV